MIAFGSYDVAIAGGVEHMAATRWARASTPTRGSSPSGSSTPTRS